MSPLLQICSSRLLANNINKQNFINLLGQRLVENGYQVLNAAGDADTLIVSTALESSLENDVIVGEDTDLLVLLCFHSVAERI